MTTTLDQTDSITPTFEKSGTQTGFSEVFGVLGRSVRVVSNSENTLDMRSGVEALTNIILQRRAQTSKPIVVLIGEAHAISSQVALPQFVMQALKEKDPTLRIAHGLERSHNMLGSMLERNEVDDATARKMHKSAEDDPDGITLKEAYLKYGKQQAAPFTRQNVMAYCVKHEIPVHTLELNNAISMDGDGYLDPEDSETKTIFEAVAPELLGQKVPASDETGMNATGMRIRNHAIAKNIEANIAQDIDIYVVPYGLAHLVGTAQHEDIEEYPSADSLGDILSEADVETVMVYPNVPWAKDILPSDVSNDVLDNFILFDGLDMTGFWQKPTNSEEENAEIERNEVLYLVNLNKESGENLELSGKIQDLAIRQGDWNDVHSLS